LKEETSLTEDLERTMSDLSATVAVNSRIFTPTTTATSSSRRDVTGSHNNTTSSGYEPGTWGSRDDDVIADDDDDGDVRVSWSDSTASQRPSVARLYHLVSLFRIT